MKFLLLTIYTVALLGVLQFSQLLQAQETSLTLAENGKARAVIVMATGDAAGKSVLPMSQLLASHLTQMTGAHFDVIKDTDLGEVAVDQGRIVPANPRAGVNVYLLLGEGTITKKCGVTTEALGPGGIVLQSLSNAIIIMGHADNTNPGGNGYAVFQFLETLGCRYLWPGDLGKVIPNKPTLTIPSLNVHYSPIVAQRNIRFLLTGPRNFDKGLERLGYSQADYLAAFNNESRMTQPGNWAQWNRIGGFIGIVGGHAGYGLVGGWEEYGKSHPDWFALQPNGSRDQTAAKERWRCCISNPGLVEQVAKIIIEEANKNPTKRCFLLAPNDGGFFNHCMCDECKKLDPPDAPKISLVMFESNGTKRSEILYPSLTDRHVHYWNAVAEKVLKVHPDILFSIDAYAEYATAPVREKLNPSLVLRYVPSSVEEWDAWKAAGAKRIFWRPNNLANSYRVGVLNIQAGTIVNNARFLAQNGMLATDVDCIMHNWATQGLNYYATARIFWNPNLTYAEILDDYCKSGFGPAADAIKNYFVHAEENFMPYGVSGRGPNGEKSKLTPQVIALLKSDLQSALTAAGSDEPIRKRIHFLAAGLKYTAETVDLYEASLKNPTANPSIMANRWASMRSLFTDYPTAINVGVIAANDEILLRAFGNPVQGKVIEMKPENKNEDWLYEDQTRLKK